MGSTITATCGGTGMMAGGREIPRNGPTEDRGSLRVTDGTSATYSPAAKASSMGSTITATCGGTGMMAGKMESLGDESPSSCKFANRTTGAGQRRLSV
ncbi:MAG: hypothetical protein ACXVIZ_07260 [Halobacteriota archaeon]